MNKNLIQLSLMTDRHPANVPALITELQVVVVVAVVVVVVVVVVLFGVIVVVVFCFFLPC